MDNPMNLVRIPVGELITISTGEYSDYCVRGVFRVLKEIDGPALVAAFPGHKDKYGCDLEEFLAWVAKEGYIEDVPSSEWHLGAYGTIEMNVYSRE